MKLKNGAEYIESLRKIHPIIYYKGERIQDVTRHPATAPHVRAAAMTYALASSKEYRDLATATSHLTGRTISRFTDTGPRGIACSRDGQSVFFSRVEVSASDLMLVNDFR